jgi:Putative auto-transporter adhesin, head GIN domain
MTLVAFPAALAVILVAIIAPAQAETLSRSLDGTRLDLRMSCFKSVAIDPEPSLQGKIEVEARADTRDELDRLTLAGGDAARIERTGNCDFKLTPPTLTLDIKVPPATSINLHDVSTGTYGTMSRSEPIGLYKIGPVTSMLKVELDGTGDVEAASSTGVDLRIEGSGDFTLHHLDGPAKIDIRGSGDVRIDSGTAPQVAIDLHGSGDVKLGLAMGALQVDASGSGDIAADQTKSLDLHGAGSGNLELDRLDGHGKIEIRGSGDVSIGNGNMPSLAMTLHGSGNVEIGAGEIGSLIASTAGSGDIRIDGTAKDATLTTEGSGDISVAGATGAVQSHQHGSGTITIGH